MKRINVMKNRSVGVLLIGIAILMAFIILSFNRALSDIVSSACTHGSSCPMWGTIRFQTNVSIGITVFVILIGLYLIFFGKEEKVIVQIIKERVKPKEISKKSYRNVLKTLKNGDEKLIFESVIEAKGSILQSEIIKITGMSKVKVTRSLDRLEGRGLVERKRRGMSNVVVLKH